MTMKKLLVLLIFITMGQLVAFLFSLLMEFPNGHVIMLIGSLFGFIFGYKEESKKA
jgi:xanthosine utilization system XapX-like protein